MPRKTRAQKIRTQRRARAWTPSFRWELVWGAYRMDLGPMGQLRLYPAFLRSERSELFFSSSNGSFDLLEKGDLDALMLVGLSWALERFGRR